MTTVLARRIAAAEEAAIKLTAPDPLPPHGLAPEEYHRQIAVLCAMGYDEALPDEAPEGIHPGLFASLKRLYSEF